MTQPQPKSAKEVMAEFIAKEDEIKAQLDAVAQEQARLQKILDAAKAKKWELRQAVIQEEKEEAARKRREAEEAAKLQQQERLLLQAATFDLITKDKKWRERALEHQLVGSSYLAAAERAICADDMGVGKTLQGCMWLDKLDAKRTLVICPGEIMQGFVDEFNRWTDRPIVVIGKKPRADAIALLKIFATMPKFVVIINYEAWNRSMAIVDELIKTRFDSVIVDEAHYIKETDGKPFEGVRKIVLAENCCPQDSGELELDRYTRLLVCKSCKWNSSYVGSPVEDRCSVKYLLAMTGTPILNRPSEIFPLLHLIKPKLFQHKSTFIKDYCQYDYSGKLEWKPGGHARLANELSAFYLRRTKETAGIQLPPQSVMVHEIEFDKEMYPKQARIMETLRKHSAMEVSSGRVLTITDLLALLTRERQAAVWPGGIQIPVQLKDEFGNLRWDWDNPYKNGEPRPVTEMVPVGQDYKESQKLDRAIGLGEELAAAGHRVVYFSQFTTALDEAAARLGSRAVKFTGATPDALRWEIKKNFNRELGEEPRWDYVLCNFKTGGEGLNLTAATHIIVLDEEWNPGKNNQAYARLNRIGQTEPTTVHILRLVSDISKIDQWLSELIMAKADLIAGFTEEIQARSDVAVQMQTELQQILNGDWK